MNETVERVALLPCPFCGGDAYTSDGDDRWFVSCRDCYCNVGEAYDRDAWPEHMFATEAEAIAAWNARAAIAAMPERGMDPFMVDNFAAMWTDWADADWQLVTDPTTFLEQCEDAGLAECVEVDDDALDDAFAAERGIEPGGMMWRLTDAGRARYAATLPTPPEPTT